jgi:hypothetical protein
VLGTDSGDIVDSLQGRIRAKSNTVKAGEDIPVEFELRFANPAVVKDGRFAREQDSVFVWDGKYSNGYRNHAFLVRTPDGESHLLRPKVIGAWDKNVPHPVEVKEGKPYVLPEWFEGKTFKSLKALGLDTSQPGTYSITGVYQETGSTGKAFGTECMLWGGEIATNTIVVEVVKDR